MIRLRSWRRLRFKWKDITGSGSIVITGMFTDNIEATYQEILVARLSEACANVALSKGDVVYISGISEILR